jgi:hypothetical protein
MNHDRAALGCIIGLVAFFVFCFLKLFGVD